MNRPSLKWRGVLVLLLGVPGRLCQASRPGHDGLPGVATANTSATPEVCESKTINYITHTLPQQCLRTSWTSPAGGGQATTPTATGGQAPEATQQDDSTRSENNATENKSPEGDKAAPAAQGEGGDGSAEGDEELATSSFMSFEEWKEMMLRKSGQDPENIKGQKQREHRERDPATAQPDIYSIGDEGEISLDFDVLSDKVSEMAAPPPSDAAARSGSIEAREDQVMYVDGTYRSKDAGKTCKERFSFSSFDAGATVLKSSPGAKSPNSILVENKDSYMLLECHTKNKYVIVELSDDILVDTVVLANYEFFSSMIRKFRVSVSARYPVKLDKWVDLGTFQARNSRDIQAFLIPHPQIYTKYIRIEFLTHYGTEYYCPVSLLRVHGTRMLDTWKEPDNSPEDYIEDTVEAPVQEPKEPNVEIEDAEEVAVPPSTSSLAEREEGKVEYVGEVGLSPWQPLFGTPVSHETCMLSSQATSEATLVPSGLGSYSNISISPPPMAGPTDLPKAGISGDVASSKPPAASSTSQTAPSDTSVPGATSSGSSASPGANEGTGGGGGGGSSQQKQASNRANATDAHAAYSSKTSGASHTTSRNKTSAASSAAGAAPTVQESFFKAVTKRLQHLESNTSLSLQYIEDQSRFLQDALQKMEKKQINRVDAFLESLNKTVLTELRTLRTQYDQIWQSTVLALETQREQSEREIFALSSRLNILADEVVFQKRMAILQSVLLLSCLILVIFSRGFVSAPLDIGLNPQGSISAPALLSPGSPRGFFSRNRVDDSPPPARPSAVTRVSSGRHPLSRSLSYNDKVLPLTPTSELSREGTPIIQIDEIEVPFFEDAGRSGYTAVTPPRSTVGNDIYPDLDCGESTPEPGKSEPRLVPLDEEDVDEEPTSLLRHSHSTKLQLGGVGGARKPLPALPEDPV
ncbi:hypothetical protein GQ53DRAFT_744633 [Thozetella sp. PMI_491]|nr:hypothetical protein GQ53DRAFT_744633 [Thozetella sp. PMI_491]